MHYQPIRLYTVILTLAYATLPASAMPKAELDCLIEPYVTVNISNSVSSLLNTVTVERGEVVKKGQVLATLEASVEAATVEVYRARAAMESTIKANHARLELSARNHSRNEGMFQKALIPADKMDETETPNASPISSCSAP